MLEEDPEMYEAAGIPYQPPSTSTKIQQAIQSAITSVPSLQAANVTVKVLVMQDNHGSVNFYINYVICSFYVSFLVKYLYKNH